MTQMRDTSLEAYNTLKPLTKREQVYSVIREHGPCSDQEVADRLGWSVNRVTGRRNELMKLGAIRIVGTKKNEFNRRVYVWGCSVSQEQLKLL